MNLQASGFKHHSASAAGNATGLADDQDPFKDDTDSVNSIKAPLTLRGGGNLYHSRDSPLNSTT